MADLPSCAHLIASFDGIGDTGVVALATSANSAPGAICLSTSDSVDQAGLIHKDV